MSVFGPLVSRGSIDQSILSLLSSPPVDGGAPLIVYYLAAVERALGLTPQTIPPPPGPSSYRSETDFDTFQAEWLPLIGVRSQPSGTIERFEGGQYGLWYEVQLAAIVGDDDEDEARGRADAYGIAIAAAVTQNAKASGVASDVILASAPTVSYVDPDVRQVSRADLVIHAYVQPILIDRAEVLSWPTDPYEEPTGYPEAQTVEVEGDMDVVLTGAGDDSPAVVAGASLPRLD